MEKQRKAKLMVRGGRAILRTEEMFLSRQQVEGLCETRKRRLENVESQIVALQKERDKIAQNIALDEACLAALDSGKDLDPEGEDQG
jgi:hypothetical protein